MLTRNYYNALASFFLNGASNLSSYNGNPTADDKYRSVKAREGSVRETASVGFVSWSNGTSDGQSAIYPDLTDTAPALDDYAMPDFYRSSGGTRFNRISHRVQIEDYNEDNAEYTVKVEYVANNNTGVEKTVYGIYVYKYISSGMEDNSPILFAREKFTSPIIVPANANVVLTLTYKVSKAGILIQSANGGV